MGYAKQVVGRTGARGALTTLVDEKVVLVPKDDFHVVPNEERELLISHKSRTRCCSVLRRSQ